MCYAPFPTTGSLADPYSSGHMLNTNGSHKKLSWYLIATVSDGGNMLPRGGRDHVKYEVYSADGTCSCGNMSTHPIQLAVGEILYFRAEKHQIPIAVTGVSLSEPHIDM